ncbi:MAG: thiamine biosynthesis protein ApbE [Azospira oryzae]|jgi:thiamine biosynthesis lipoprotein|nr:MAG: thiamine biosynthesis protein ApbE [Azospira oryzae]
MNRFVRYTLLFILIAFIPVAGCRYLSTSGSEPLKAEGQTMGTTYHITYFDEQKRDFSKSIDSLLVLVNKSINTYDRSSEITSFNTGKSFRFTLPYFLPLIEKSREVYTASSGAFDPTVMPLVNAWGFGPAREAMPDSARVDSLRQLVGFNKIVFNQDSVWKKDTRMQLDFGGIGQGYGADIITHFLRAKGIKNMLVELGGEGMACGINLKSGKAWELGILDPNSTEVNQFMKAYVMLTDRSYTTAGTYFNYYEVDGRKYAHTIDPTTGYPAQNELLSVSVFATDCTTADAWDTALMAMGKEKAMATLQQHPEIDALLIFSTPQGLGTFATEKITPYLSIQ